MKYIFVAALLSVLIPVKAQTNWTLRTEQRAVYQHSAQRCAACGKKLKEPNAWVVHINTNAAIFFHVECISPLPEKAPTP